MYVSPHDAVYLQWFEDDSDETEGRTEVLFQVGSPTSFAFLPSVLLIYDVHHHSTLWVCMCWVVYSCVRTVCICYSFLSSETAAQNPLHHGNCCCIHTPRQLRGCDFSPKQLLRVGRLVWERMTEQEKS